MANRSLNHYTSEPGDTHLQLGDDFDERAVEPGVLLTPFLK